VTAKRKKRPYLLVVLLGLCVSLIGVGTFALMRSFLNSGTGAPKKTVQEIHLIRPPPPPPDVPPPPPPPPEEKVDVHEPEQQPDPTPSNEPPPSEQLGLDAEGTAGGDAFGLVGNKGGRDLLASGGSAFMWYAGLLKNEIQESLSAEKQTRSGNYSVNLRVWVRDDGTIDRVRIIQGSGNPDRDRAIESALSRISRLSQAPPADMPQPINLRIVSHG
jgi:periplasmic protein TonB